MLCTDADDEVVNMQREMDELIATWSQQPGCPTDWEHFDLWRSSPEERAWLQGFVSAVKQMDINRHYMTFYQQGVLELRLWKRQLYHGKDRLVSCFPGCTPRTEPVVNAMAIPQGEGTIVGYVGDTTDVRN